LKQGWIEAGASVINRRPAREPNGGGITMARRFGAKIGNLCYGPVTLVHPHDDGGRARVRDNRGGNGGCPGQRQQNGEQDLCAARLHLGEV